MSASKKKRTLLILDSHAIVHRSYHALPPLTSKGGKMVNAVYGYASVLLKVLKEFKPDYVVAAFDREGGTFRDTMYEEYKANRVEADQELIDQFPVVREMLNAMNICILDRKGYEADDVIGTVVSAANVDAPDVESIIVTGDMDTVQLIDDNTKVYTLRKGLTDTVLMDERIVKERYGFPPERMVDYKALSGDPSDNIPGVRGIGPKTATELLEIFGSLDGIYAAIKKGDKRLSKVRERVITLLKEYEKDAHLSYKLATIRRDAPITFSFEDADAKRFDREKALAFFQSMGFKSLLIRLPEGQTQSALDLKQQSSSTVKPAGTSTLIDSNEAFETFLADLKQQRRIAVDTETTSLNVREAELIGMSFSWKTGEAAYINLNDNQGTEKRVHPRHAWIRKLKGTLESATIEKIGHNLKYDIAVLERAGIVLKPLTADTMIASYLLTPETRSHSLDNLAMAEFAHTMIPIESLIGKKGKDQKQMQLVPLADLATYAAEDADFTWRLGEQLLPRLEKQGIGGLLTNVEMPLIRVLHHMEQNGIMVDTTFLRTMSASLGRTIASLEKKIYHAAGKEFNIASTQQLKEVLFTTLKLDAKKLGFTKTGVSTRAAELEKIRGEHPVVDAILEYRELTKLKSTYLDALPEMIDSTTGRIHTSFNQTVAATGRLSSNNPNLQNIPIRTELGRQIRKAFVTKRGWRLISADYSQIELRIIASLAEDKRMIASFEAGEDIHARTAANVHGKDLADVTKEERRAAKAINFGIIYGMGTASLARQTGLQVEDAKAFIEKYFALHEGISSYLERTKALARKQGYVETLFGRRRPVPEIQSNIQQVRAAGERIAVNMPIQGTAADLMKIAMIAVDRKLASASKDARLLLQVHDELVLEAPAADVEKVSSFLTDTMENVYKLRVPIKVEVASGKNWDEAH